MDHASNSRKLIQWSQRGLDVQWDIEPEVVVWVDVVCFDELWRKDLGFYIPPGGVGFERYPKTYDWLKTLVLNKIQIYMPSISLESGVVSFSDGRHRFAWLRDAGAAGLPVEAAGDVAENLKILCPTAVREAWLPIYD